MICSYQPDLEATTSTGDPALPRPSPFAYVRDAVEVWVHDEDDKRASATSQRSRGGRTELGSGQQHLAPLATVDSLHRSCSFHGRRGRMELLLLAQLCSVGWT